MDPGKRDPGVYRVLDEVALERARQDEKWGEQNHPDGTGRDPWRKTLSDVFRERCDRLHQEGKGTWEHILLEEVYEALAEHDPGALRKELLQVAAVCVVWMEAIDRRTVGKDNRGDKEG